MAKKKVCDIVFERWPGHDEELSVTFTRVWAPTVYSKIRRQSRTYYFKSNYDYQMAMMKVGVILGGYLCEKVEYGRHIHNGEHLLK